jgi:hypothetical protein
MSDEYILGVWRQGPDQKGMDIIESIEIGKEEFDSYVKAIAAYQSLSERPTYQILTRNHQRLAAMRDTYTNLERVGGSFRTVDKHSVNVAFMGEVTNWLTSTRLYLESERDFILRQFGDGSDQLQQYEAATSLAFDSYPGYRFLYNLRDYAQHCGPPLSGMEVKAGPKGSRAITFYLSRSELLVARFNWSRHAQELLNQWPEQISLMPLIDEAMVGFRLIEDEVLRILIRRCGEAISTMRDGIARVGSTDGHPAVFRLPGSNERGKLAWQTFPESSALDVIKQALVASDPLAAIRHVPLPEPTPPPGQRHADSQAAAVIATWLEHDSGVELAAVINRVLEEDESIDPLISGLVNLSVTLLMMLEQALGAPRQELLGGFVADSN